MAEKVLRLISDADWIELRGKQGIRLHGSDSMIEVSDKVQVFSSTPMQFHCNIETHGSKNFSQPAPIVRKSEENPIDSKERKQKVSVLLRAHSALRRAYANMPYVLYKDGVEVKTDLTDEYGKANFEREIGATGFKIKLGNGDEFVLKNSDDLSGQGDDREKLLSNQGYRALNDSADGRDHTN